MGATDQVTRRSQSAANDLLLKAVFELLTSGPEAVAKRREDTFAHYEERARQLEAEEERSEADQELEASDMMELAVDSGASETVVGESMLPCVETRSRSTPSSTGSAPA